MAPSNANPGSRTRFCRFCIAGLALRGDTMPDRSGGNLGGRFGDWAMAETAETLAPVTERAPIQGMVRIDGGTFRMGSDRHYPEEAPAHRVTVDGFWMDRYPVTNRQFKEFVRATKHITVAEITPDPKDYPG